MFAQSEPEARLRVNRGRVLRVLVTVVVIAAALLLVAPTASRADDNPQSAETGLSAERYPVEVDGYPIFEIQEPLGSDSAEQRAANVSARLQRLVRDSSLNLDQLHTQDKSFGTLILFGDRVIMAVTDADARYSGLPANALAQHYVDLIKPVIQQARNEHTPRALGEAAIYGVITLSVFGLLFWGVLAGSNRLIVLIERSAHTKIKGLKIQQTEIVAAERLARGFVTTIRLGRLALLLVLTFLFLSTEFNYFPWTRRAGNELLAYVLSPVKTVFTAILNYLPKAFFIIVVMVFTHYLLRMVKAITREVKRGRIHIRGLYPEWVDPTYNITRFLIIAFAAVVIVPYLPGEESPAFKGIGVFLGLLVSLGSTGAVSNVVSGIVITYSRSFKVGDWVTIGDVTGEIAAQTLLATQVKTAKNVEVTIPNSVVLSSHVKNFSMLAQTEGVILHTSVTIGYDAPWRTIHELLINAARKTKFILEDPAPFVLQNALDDSYVEYMINAYTRSPHEMVNIYSELHANIQDSFYEAGVEIMSPIFQALRDGNRVAIPDTYLPKGYRPPAFRINKVETKTNGDEPHS